jgi:hypothetical protein
MLHKRMSMAGGATEDGAEVYVVSGSANDSRGMSSFNCVCSKGTRIWATTRRPPPSSFIPHPGFAQDLENGKIASTEVAAVGTTSNTSLITLGYVSQIVAQFGEMNPFQP